MACHCSFHNNSRPLNAHFSTLRLYSQWWLALDVVYGAPDAQESALPKFAEHIAGAVFNYSAFCTISLLRKSDLRSNSFFFLQRTN